MIDLNLPEQYGERIQPKNQGVGAFLALDGQVLLIQGAHSEQLRMKVSYGVSWPFKDKLDGMTVDTESSKIEGNSGCKVLK